MSTRVFYISLGICCPVIFLAALVLAVLHLHRMKRIELEESISASSSSQGLSQYVRGNTPNSTTPISSYPTLWVEEEDLRSVALLEARAKVNDIKISFQREELKRYIF